MTTVNISQYLRLTDDNMTRIPELATFKARP
jgi:hypothetical protein